MRLVVCGDSFMSADTNRPGTHFSEILQSQGYDVINLARGGISNTGIAFQLEAASKLKPDAIIFSSTDTSRVDVVVGKFNPLKGLKNFIYPYASDSSTGSDYVGGLDAAIMSDVIVSQLSSRPDLPSKLHNLDQIAAIKQYVSWFHDDNFKRILDGWLLGYWKYRLTENRIPVIHLYENGPLGQHMYNYTRQHPGKRNQCVYHTDNYTQVLMAQELSVELKKLIII